MQDGMWWHIGRRHSNGWGPIHGRVALATMKRATRLGVRFGTHTISAVRRVRIHQPLGVGQLEHLAKGAAVANSMEVTRGGGLHEGHIATRDRLLASQPTAKRQINPVVQAGSHLG